jgi:hypothetical protein
MTCPTDNQLTEYVKLVMTQPEGIKQAMAQYEDVHNHVMIEHCQTCKDKLFKKMNSKIQSRGRGNGHRTP